MSAISPTTSQTPGTSSHVALSDGWRSGWWWLLISALARGYLAFALTLAVAATAPVLLGWHPYTILTGSMTPSIHPGDVVVASALADQPVPLGRVVVVTRPGPDRTTQTIVHRVILDRGDGTFTTAGDANRSWDSSAVPRADILAQGRLLVPFVGLPRVWIADQDWTRLLLLLLLTAVAVLASWRNGTVPPAPALRVPPPGSTGEPLSRPDATRLLHRRWPALRPTVARWLLVAVMVVVVTVVATAGSAYSAETRSAGNSWTSASRVLLPYTRAVLTDTPWASYFLDDATGPTAADLSGHNRPGTWTGSVTYRQPGALTSANPGYAALLSGGGARMVAGGTALSAPTTFTLELWFKTTTTTGGKMIGFESTTASTSAKADRHLFMRNDGKLTYGGWSNGALRSITTTKALKDGAWHYVAVTARPNGTNQISTIYVDGVANVTGTTTATSAYTGWWRLGYGALPTGSAYPSSADFEGTLDNAAIYTSELSAAQIGAHFAAK